MNWGLNAPTLKVNDASVLHVPFMYTFPAVHANSVCWNWNKHSDDLQSNSPLCSVPNLLNCVDHLVYCTDHLVYCTDHLVYRTDHLVYCTDRLVYRTDHRVYRTDRLVYCTDHRVYCIDHRVYCTDPLHFEPLQWVGNRLDIQGIRVLLLAGRKKTFSSLKHLCWPWNQGPTHHSVQEVPECEADSSPPSSKGVTFKSLWMPWGHVAVWRFGSIHF